MNKQSSEPNRSFWSIFGTETCYTDDWIPVFISNQMMQIKAKKITRDSYGPEEIYHSSGNVPNPKIMQGGEMPDIGQIMEEAEKTKLM